MIWPSFTSPPVVSSISSWIHTSPIPFYHQHPPSTPEKHFRTLSRPLSTSLPMSMSQRPFMNLITSETTTNWDITLKSPCKINLFLRILGKRSDGYHELASLFQVVGLYDILSISLKNPTDIDWGKDTLLLDDKNVNIPIDENNLILKAFHAYRLKRQHNNNNKNDIWFRVKLVKNIPCNAGLGGGSGNAATALWGANELVKKEEKLDIRELEEIGAEFASDVSLFFSNGCVMGYGRGEILKKVDHIVNRDMVVYLVKPNEGLGTKHVFKELNLTETDPNKNNPNDLLRSMKHDLLNSDHHINDLEKPSFRLLPRLAMIKSKLVKLGFKVVSMTGSGTTFYCLGEPDVRYAHIFPDQFEQEYRVKIYRTSFIYRNHPDKWYFEQVSNKTRVLSIPQKT